MTLEEYRNKMDKHYYDGEKRLVRWPSKRPMRIMALLSIAERFSPGMEYTEKEVNGIIASAIAFNDIELMRRELIDTKLMGRLRDGSKYWLEGDFREMADVMLEE